MLHSPREIHPSNQKSIIEALQLQTLHRGKVCLKGLFKFIANLSLLLNKHEVDSLPSYEAYQIREGLFGLTGGAQRLY